MLEIKDIEKLADLARLEISQEEKENLRNEFDGILKYVGEIQKISGDPGKKEVGAVHNVMRDDAHPHLPGEFTEDLLANAPASQDGYIKVKKIL